VSEAIRYLSRIPAGMWSLRDEIDEEATSPADAAIELSQGLMKTTLGLAKQYGYSTVTIICAAMHICQLLQSRGNESIVWVSSSGSFTPYVPIYIYHEMEDGIVSLFNQIEGINGALSRSSAEDEKMFAAKIASATKINGVIVPITEGDGDDSEKSMTIFAEDSDEVLNLLQKVLHALRHVDHTQNTLLSKIEAELHSDRVAIDPGIAFHVIETISASLPSGTKLGLNDNYFYVGGSSLKAFRVINGINDRLGIDISLKDLFENPVISHLCLIVQERLRSAVL
jgi:hypothetical protein